VPALLILGITAVVIAGFNDGVGNNPFSNIPTIIVGVSMILLAIILSVVSKREYLDGVESETQPFANQLLK
jgi:hypothetical protein